jgi:hypothetical protein
MLTITVERPVLATVRIVFGFPVSRAVLDHVLRCGEFGLTGDPQSTAARIVRIKVDVEELRRLLAEVDTRAAQRQQT